MKLQPAWVGGARVAVLVIELAVDGEKAWLDQVEARLRAPSA